MKIVLPLISLLISFFVFAPGAFAGSNLEVSDRSSFATPVRDFRGGQTIHVRINAGAVSPSASSKLNLRDNGYNLLNSFSLSRDGSYFSTVIPAPYSPGYYSLEAAITGIGSNVTSVKTIKVGEVNGASVKVNINSKVQGESVSSSSQDESEKDSGDSVQSSPDLSPSPSAETQVYVAVKQTFWQRAGDFFKKFWRFIF